MNKPSARARTIAAGAATPVAVLVAGAIVWQSSYAAFSGTTRNSGNDWATGSVALTDDDAGSARFQVASMTPGDTDTRCITVTATATTPGLVKGYAVNPVKSAQGLEKYVKIKATSGTGGGFGSCDGFTELMTVIPDGTSLETLALADDYSKGSGGWAVPVGTTSRTYKITWTFDTDGLTQQQVDQLQGAHTGIDFQWELQSTE